MQIILNIENCRPYMECAVHICDVKHFPLDSTARILRKHRGNEVEEWSFINKLYLATNQMQTQARFYGRDLHVYQATLQKETSELMIKRRSSNLTYEAL